MSNPQIDTDAIEFALGSIEYTIRGMEAKMLTPSEIASRLRADAAIIRAKLPPKMTPGVKPPEVVRE